MPYFQVNLSGRGICLTTEASEPAIGFFTTRTVKAADRDEASSTVMQAVAEEWRNGSYAAANRGSPPSLIVESARKLPLLRGFFSRSRTGYIFYQRDE